MFNKLRRYYNQNRRKIWKVIGICAFVIIIIQIANYWAGQSLKKDNDKPAVSKKDEYQRESIISDKKIEEKVAKQNNKTIDEFVQYCNDGKIESAYAMLTDECKTALYKNIENFKNYYYNRIFTTKKLYTKENWYSDDNLVTYRVVYTNDILADGIEKSDETFGDYITVVKDKEQYKLNIGQFINYKEIDKIYENSDIKIEIISAKIFRMYEIYSIKFYNKTNGEIYLYDTQIDSNLNWHLEDKESNKAKVAISEVPGSYLKIESEMTQNIEAKFTKTYNPDKKTKKIVFENININGNLNKIEIDL